MYTQLGIEVSLEPERAAAKIAKAIDSEGGRLHDVADALGVSRVTLWRWLGRLEKAGYGLRERIEAARGIR